MLNEYLGFCVIWVCKNLNEVCNKGKVMNNSTVLVKDGLMVYLT